MGLTNKISDLLAKIDAIDIDQYEDEFAIRYTYESNSIEGNKMNYEDVKALIEKKQIQKDTTLIDLFETVNHLKVYKEMTERVMHNQSITAETVKDMHSELMDNIMQGGSYRNHPVKIKGSTHKPPSGLEMHEQIKHFFNTLVFEEEKRDPIEMAAYMHAEFLRIHPFTDGNGRTSRLIMNHQLIKKGYLPISIPPEEKEKYFKCLEEYEFNDNLNPLIRLICKFEIKEVQRLSSYKTDNNLKKRR